MTLSVVKKRFQRVIGVDISSEKIDIHDSQNNLSGEVLNTFAAVKNRLLSKLDPTEDVRVICEDTGGYEYVLVDSLHDAGINVCVANPRQVRGFAKGHGFLEKEGDHGTVAKLGP